MIKERFKVLASNLAVGLIWKTAFRPSYAMSTIRRNFDRLGGATAESLMQKYPNAKFDAIRLGGIPAECIQTTVQPERTLFYIHGGGYCAGSLALYRRNGMRIAHRCRAKVVIVDYRLAPEHPFPAALDDLRKAYEALIAGEGAENLILVGDSAGGGLLLSMILSLRDAGIALPKRVVCISPWTDLTVSASSIRTHRLRDFCINPDQLTVWGRYYFGHADPKDCRVSPVFGDYRGLPPMLFFVGSEEILQDDTLRVVEKIRKVGGVVELDIGKNMQHVWFLAMPWLAESRRAFERFAGFVAG